MIPGALARRYARALLELAAEKGLEDKILGELGSFAEIFHGSDDLRQTLTSIMVPVQVRRKVLDEILRRLMASDLTKKFLLLLDAKNRMVGVEDIHRSYKSLVDEKLGRVDAEVITPSPLGMAESAALKQKLEKVTGKKVMLQQTVDESMIGGIITRVGNLVLDGSVKSFLEEARQSLMSRSQ
ncbi:MAG: ATP synthase F1 subunit delta [Deltaproteobacteria bacterium]|nr:ATP synthase F1 subunit delta [Deltaproteobacteria bacterium]